MRYQTAPCPEPRHKTEAGSYALNRAASIKELTWMYRIDRIIQCELPAGAGNVCLMFSDVTMSLKLLHKATSKN